MTKQEQAVATLKESQERQKIELKVMTHPPPLTHFFNLNFVCLILYIFAFISVDSFLILQTKLLAVPAAERVAADLEFAARIQKGEWDK